MPDSVRVSGNEAMAGNGKLVQLESPGSSKPFNPHLMVQRLAYPDKTPSQEHAFGPFGAGGSGLKGSAYLAVNRIFAFDYMGDATYEFGKMQETLSAIWEDGNSGRLAKGKVEVGADAIYYICHRDMEKDVRRALKTIATHEHLGNRSRLKSKSWIALKESLEERREFPLKARDLEQRRREAEHMRERLKGMKAGEHKKAKISLESLEADIWRTEASIERKPQWRAGGIEHNNQFMFFIEQEMWEKASALFRVDSCIADVKR